MKHSKNLLKSIYLPNFRYWLNQNSVSVTEKEVSRGGGTFSKASYFEPVKFNGEVVIVMHSTGCDRFMPLVEMHKFLLSSGFRTIAIDLDGHGKDSTSIFDYKVLLSSESPHILDDLYKCFEAKVFQNGVMLVGQSLGGCMAIDFLSSSKLSSLVSKAVLIGTPANLSLKKVSLLKESYDFISPTLWSSITSYGIPGVIPIPGKVRRRTFPIRFKENRGYLAEILGYINGLETSERIKSIKTPLLNIYGGLDSIAQNTADLNRFDNVTAHYMPRATHYSILYSTEYFRSLVDFLR